MKALLEIGVVLLPIWIAAGGYAFVRWRREERRRRIEELLRENEELDRIIENRREI